MLIHDESPVSDLRLSRLVKCGSPDSRFTLSVVFRGHSWG